MIRCLSVCLISCSLVLFSACLDDPSTLGGAPEPASSVATSALAPGSANTQRTVVISPMLAVVASNWFVDFSGAAGTSRGFIYNTAPGRFALPFQLAEGDRMLSLTVPMFGDGTLDIYADVLGVTPTGAVDVVGTKAVHSVPPPWTDYTIDLASTVVTGGHSYWIEFYGTGFGRVGAVRLTYDHPL